MAADEPTSDDLTSGERHGPPVYGDEPVQSATDDTLGRVRVAQAIARQVGAVSSDDGFVIGIAGPWGSGKTSLLNMVMEAVRANDPDVIELRFNPWLFSSAEELVVRFLLELSAQLDEEQNRWERYISRRAVKRAADQLRGYANEVRPVGGLFGLAAAAAGGAASALAGSSSVVARRDEAKKALSELNRRVVVIVDDLDRVEDEQIREVVRLAKLVGDFPNTVYLLAYDADAVAHAVGAGNREVGRRYMEKIVQAQHALPLIPDWLVNERLLAAIQALYDSFAAGELGPFDSTRWANLYVQSVRPLFGSVRDIHRYANTLPVALESIGNEVALADVLALEALRIFAPRAWATTSTATQSELTGPRSLSADDAFDEIAGVAGQHEQAARTMLETLFRQDTHNARARRHVVDPTVRKIYYERARPGSVSPADAVQRALELSGDHTAFETFLASFSPAEREDVLTRLEDFQEEFDQQRAAEFIAGVYNQLPGLREEDRGMFSWGPEIQIGRLALRMLEKIPTEAERLTAVEGALPLIRQFSSKLELLFLVGHRENVGHKQIPESESQLLLARTLDEALAAPPEQLASERFLWDLFYRAYELSGPSLDTELRELAQDDRVFVRLLRSRFGYRRSQTLGEAAVRREPSLPWESLVEMLGEDFIAQKLKTISTSALKDERDTEALETARRYLRGELPSEHWRDHLTPSPE